GTDRAQGHQLLFLSPRLALRAADGGLGSASPVPSRASLLRPVQGLRVLLALGQSVVAVHSEPFPLLLLAVGPDNRDRTDLVRFSQSEALARVAGRQVTAAPLGEAPLGPVADLQAHARPHHVAVLLAPEFDAEPVVAAGLRLVPKDGNGGSVYV